VPYSCDGQSKFSKLAKFSKVGTVKKAEKLEKFTVWYKVPEKRILIFEYPHFLKHTVG